MLLHAALLTPHAFAWLMRRKEMHSVGPTQVAYWRASSSVGNRARGRLPTLARGIGFALFPLPGPRPRRAGSRVRSKSRGTAALTVARACPPRTRPVPAAGGAAVQREDAGGTRRPSGQRARRLKNQGVRPLHAPRPRQPRHVPPMPSGSTFRLQAPRSWPDLARPSSLHDRLDGVPCADCGY
jgi:hypothetical protein